MIFCVITNRLLDSRRAVGGQAQVDPVIKTELPLAHIVSEMAQFHFTPDQYLQLMHSEVPAFEELQDRIAADTTGLVVIQILELGTGTGETAKRVLEKHPAAQLTGLDASAEMLSEARHILPSDQVENLLTRKIESDLPEGPFDLAISALTVHHLKGPDKRDLFRRVAAVLRPGGRFVMGDVVEPDDPTVAVTPLSQDYDFPSRTEDLMRWLDETGFETRVVWESKDLAIFSADRL